MNYQDIDWNSPRGEAYRAAKEAPGQTFTFQTEEGIASVYYRKGRAAEGVSSFLEGLKLEAKTGFWFEKPQRDMTKVTPDANPVGFRVYDVE